MTSATSCAREAAKRSISVRGVSSVWRGSISSARICSPTAVPPGSRSGSTSNRAARRWFTSSSACVVFPAPSGPSSVTNQPRAAAACPGLLGIDHHAAERVGALALRREAVALNQLVLQPAEVGILRTELYRLGRGHDLRDRLFSLPHRLLFRAHAVLHAEDLPQHGLD